MAGSAFVDTSGWYALIDRKDARHARVVAGIRRFVEKRVTLVTSDYVVDESATLLKARIGSHAALNLFAYLSEATSVEWEWVGSERFTKAQSLFKKLGGQGHSFTDCTSLVIIQERQIEDVVTTDRHFKIQGLRPLLRHAT